MESIEHYQSGDKAEYKATEEGKNVFEEEVNRLEKMLEDAKKAGQL